MMNLMTMFATPVQEPRAKNSYPAALAELLQTQFGLAAKAHGADVGAGSGRLTANLLEHRYSMTAVEPRVDKRRDCAALKTRWPKLNVVAGTATATGLADSSVDFVTSARALYSPEIDPVRKEFRRILRPGGLVLLITDNRVYSGGEQSEAYEDLLRKHCAGFREKQKPLDIGALVRAFYGGEVYEDAFVSHDCMSLVEFQTQARKLAIYPAEGDPQQARFEQALKSFFEEWAIAGEIMVPKICRAAYGYLAH